MYEHTTSPKVSIICSWYNRVDYLRATVESLLEQDFDDYEIVLINDGSSDELVKKILDEYSSPILKVIHQDNIGLTATLKKAIEEVDSPYVCVMGAGDTAHKDKTKKQYEYMESNKQVSALGTGHNLVSASSGKNLGYVEPIKKADRSTFKKTVAFTHGTVMYRRSDLMNAGSYDPFFRYCQDRDLYCRLINIGEIHSLNEMLYQKYIFDDGASFSPKHKIAQNFYLKLAVSQDRDLISFYKNNPDAYAKYINENSPIHMALTVKNIIRFAIKIRDFKLTSSWVKILLKQIMNIPRIAFFSK